MFLNTYDLSNKNFQGATKPEKKTYEQRKLHNNVYDTANRKSPVVKCPNQEPIFITDNELIQLLVLMYSAS